MGFSRICFLIFVLPVGKHEPRVNLCFAGRALCARMFSRMAFLLFPEAEVEMSEEESAAPLLG